MQYASWWNPSFRQSADSHSGQWPSLATTPKRALPATYDFETKCTQTIRVRGYSMVREVSAHHAAEPAALFRDTLMPTAQQLLADVAELGLHPLPSRSPQQEKPALSRPPADVRKAKKVERLGLRSCPGSGVPSEPNQPGLLRMQFQVESPEPCGQVGLKLPGV
jgi:hypothetical protein